MKIELSPEQLAVIGQCLENAPFKLVAPILAHLQREITAVQQAEEKAEGTPKGSNGAPKEFPHNTGA